MKGAIVKNEKVNKEDANIKDGFDNDEGSEAKNKPKVDTKAGGRETLPIRGDMATTLFTRVSLVASVV